MGPGAEPGFHLAFFLYLVVIGLAQPFGILIGAVAGWCVRRWWLATALAIAALAVFEQATTHIPPDGHGFDAVFLTAFSLSAGIWAVAVNAARGVMKRNGDRL